MTQNRILNKYFEWLSNYVIDGHRNYRKLLLELHNTEFYYTVEGDENRAKDGTKLRYIFASHRDIDIECLQGPCSVLEMMIALSNRCENQIMYDPDIGDRTGYWFWLMIDSLGLTEMADDQYDVNMVRRKIKKFLNRNYSSNGKGGLFTIRGFKQDMREIEIWYQMNFYLNTIL